VYTIYQKATGEIPWWAKALIIGGLGGAAIYAVYSIIKPPPPISPPNLQNLLELKQEAAKKYFSSYDNFTQHGTVALTQDQFNTLSQLQQMISNINEQINTEYKEQLEAQQALQNALYNAIVEIAAIIVVGGVGYGLGKQALQTALQNWFNRKKKPPQGGTEVSPNDILTTAIAKANSLGVVKYSTQTADALTLTEITIGIEALSYAYQYAGYTTNAINILNNFVPIANQNYNIVQGYMKVLSNDFANNSIIQNDFINQIVVYDTLTAATIDMLVYYSIEGFSISVSGWVNNTVNAIITNQLTIILAAIGIIAGFITIYILTSTLIELAPAIVAA
jgi:hypothetical protein